MRGRSIAGGKYRLGSAIAAGSFGKVYEDPPFAIKEMRVPFRLAQNRAVTAIISNEIRILTQLNHQHTVKLFEVVEEGDYIYIVMELCDGDLRRYTECAPVSEAQALEYLGQILRGYQELSRLGIVHRDLKPANREGTLKLADFGMSKLTEEGQLLRSHVGTPYYMAPQVLQRIDYTSKCDIWSIGVIFYELLFGCLPWNGKSEETLLSAIMTQPLKLPRTISEGVREILEGMLSIS
jgi:serine/threonine protein kinase